MNNTAILGDALPLSIHERAITDVRMLQKASSVSACVAALLVACGGSAEGGADNGGNASTSTGGTAMIDTNGCSATGTRFAMTGAFARSSTDAEAYNWDGAIPGLLGIQGTTDAKPFMFIRAGDASDGTLGEIGTYDASQYPFNIHYVQLEMPGTACDAAPNACSGFFAMGGELVVSRVTPTFDATFSLSMLVEGGGEAPGAVIAGAVDGCFSVANP